VISKEAAAGRYDAICSDRKEKVYPPLSALRIEIAKIKSLVDESRFDMFWVTDFPLFKYNEEEKRWDSEHHPFTSCKAEDVANLEKGDYGNIRSKSYDLVINGMELASGSIRNNAQLQEKNIQYIGYRRS
jgi:aspartyl-tRNA synthetase